MVSRDITIINRLGLHARAAAKFVSTAGSFSSTIKVGRSVESLVDGKSIMAVMMLAASKGTQLHIQINGADEELAMQAIEALINNFFGEGK